MFVLSVLQLQFYLCVIFESLIRFYLQLNFLQNIYFVTLQFFNPETQHHTLPSHCLLVRNNIIF